MSKYNWTPDDEIAMENFLNKVANHKACEYLSTDQIALLAYIADARHILNELDPRPNFRKADTCFRCHKYDDCESCDLSGTCDNFKREKPEVVQGLCTSCMGIHGCPFANDLITECKEYLRPTL